MELLQLGDFQNLCEDLKEAGRSGRKLLFAWRKCLDTRKCDPKKKFEVFTRHDEVSLVEGGVLECQTWEDLLKAARHGPGAVIEQEPVRVGELKKLE